MSMGHFLAAVCESSACAKLPLLSGITKSIFTSSVSSGTARSRKLSNLSRRTCLIFQHGACSPPFNRMRNLNLREDSCFHLNLGAQRRQYSSTLPIPHLCDLGLKSSSFQPLAFLQTRNRKCYSTSNKPKDADLNNKQTHEAATFLNGDKEINTTGNHLKSKTIPLENSSQNSSQSAEDIMNLSNISKKEAKSEFQSQQAHTTTVEDQIAGDIKSLMKHTRHEAAVFERKQKSSFLFLGSSKVVATAIISNFCLMSGKFFAAVMTGSPSLFAEGVHSLADLLNDCLLFFGVMRASRDPDTLHPYGFSRERYAWSLISGVGIFFLGGGVSLYHGVTGLLNPVAVSNIHYAFVALGGSLLFEGGTAVIAFHHVREAARAAGMSVIDYIKYGVDPSAVQILLEDAAAIVGVGIAAAALGATAVTKNPVYDACGSISIGILLGATAVFLIRRNLSMIVERSMPAAREALVVSTLLRDSAVKSVHDVKSTSIGLDGARFKAEVQFDGKIIAANVMGQMDMAEELKSVQAIKTQEQLAEYIKSNGDLIVEQLAEEVDRIEINIKRAVPEVKHCDLEIL